MLSNPRLDEISRREANVYNYSVSSLRVGKSSSRGLKLVFVDSEGTPPPGTVLEQEQIMKYLLIVFTNPEGMFRTCGPIKCIDN
jgi:hypothetical protein